MTACARKDCRHAGTHYIVVKAWPEGYAKSTPPLSVTIGLQFCRDHAAEEVRDGYIVTDAFWANLDRITRQLRHVAPDRASVELLALRGNVKDVLDAQKRETVQ